MGRRIDESIWNERRELLHRQATSGMSVARFCREHGVNLWNFHAWKRRLNGDASEEGQAASAGRYAAGDRPSRSFVQVPARALSAMGSGMSSWIEISSAAGIVVRVPSGNLPALRMTLETLVQENTDA